MRKRLMSFMLSAIMILSMSAFVEVNAGREDLGDALEFARALKLTDDTQKGDEVLTRAQMTGIICRMLDMMSDTDGALYPDRLKDGNSEVVVEDPDMVLEFSDVQPTDEFYSQIRTVTGRGIMVGVSKTQFMPSASMTYMQFLKVMLCMMGYSEMAEQRGGYPEGYLGIASDIGFEEIRGKDYNEHITLEEAAFIIRENLDTPVASVKYESGEGWHMGYDDKSFGEEVLGIYSYKNRVNAIGKLNLFDDKEYSENSLLVGETVFEISEGYEIDERLLGRDVTVYYREDDGDVGPLIYAELTGKDKAVTFTIDKLEEIKPDSIAYLEGARIKTLKIKPGAYFMLNGERLSEFDSECFKFDYGEVTLIQSEDEKAYNIIVVEGYNSVYVSGLDAKKQIIYPKDGMQIALSEEEKNYKITKNGEEKAFSDIMAESIIDVSKSKKRIKINIQDAAKTVTVKASGTEDDKKYIITGENEKLSFAKSFVDSTSFISPKLGGEASVLLNGNGDISWIKTGKATGSVGYFIKAINDTENEIALIKLLKEDGKTEIFTCTEKLIICDENNIEHKNVSADKFRGYFVNADGTEFSGLLRYTLDSEGKIKKIELPITNPSVKEEDKFYDLKAINGYGDIIGNFTGWTWGGMVFLGASYTKAIFIPSNDGDDSKHAVVAYGNAPIGNMRAKFYGTKPDCLDAEYMINPQSVVPGYKRPNNFKNWAVVKSRSVGYDEVKECVVDKITAVTIQTSDCPDIKEIEFTAPYIYMDESGNPCSIADVVNDVGQSRDEKGNVRTYSLGVGDIFYYEADSFNELGSASIMYKADMKNPYAEKQEKPGWLAGTYDDYRSATETEMKYSNPYSLNSSQLLSSGLSYICDVVRIHKVSPYKKSENSYLATSLDLNTYDWKDAELRVENEYKSHYLNGKRYPVFGYPYYFRGTTITLLENGDVDVKVYNTADIKTADVYGKDCSSIIQFLSWSQVVGMIIINDER